MAGAVLLLAVSVAARLLMAALVPLVPDEAYYWEWSRHLAAGYFDHPPAIAWLIRAGTMVVGDTPLGVRLVPVLVGFGGGVATLALSRRLGGDGSAWRAAALLTAVPLAGIGLVLATPDAALLACGAITLWAVDHAIDRTDSQRSGARGQGSEQPGTWGGLVWWIVAGLGLGLATASKYTAVLIPAGLAVACAASPSLRAQYRRPGPYVACVVAAIVFLPVARWNATHDWVSFRFQLHHGLGAGSGTAVDRELALIGGQAGLVSPVLFVLVVAAVVVATTRSRAPRRFVLAILALFVWAFFAVSALRHPVEPNWPALAVLLGLVLLATWPVTPRRRVWERVGIGIGWAVILAVYTHAVHPWIPLPPRGDPIAQAYGWDELANAVVRDTVVDAVSTGVGTGRRWVGADRYQDAAELAFHLPGHPVVFSLNLAGRPNQYDLWPTARDSMRLGDALTLVLSDSPAQPAPVARLAPHFRTVVPGAVVELHRGTRVVARRRLWHFLGLTAPL
jgi:4-amino-4-deoxy-L-arabinose transferase-like glycosyltransferase